MITLYMPNYRQPKTILNTNEFNILNSNFCWRYQKYLVASKTKKTKNLVATFFPTFENNYSVTSIAA